VKIIQVSFFRDQQHLSSVHIPETLLPNGTTGEIVVAARALARSIAKPRKGDSWCSSVGGELWAGYF